MAVFLVRLVAQVLASIAAVVGASRSR